MKHRILVLIGLALLMAVTAVAAKKKFTLVIDAGHGGNDAGALGALTKEKHINLNVALAFGRLVERNCPDVKVIYTRKADVFIPLHTRADIANRNKADLFISIHTNSLPKGHISRGIETYTLGMHRAADNLEVAKRENEVILYETDYKQRYQGFDPRSSESYIMFEFMQDHNMAQSVELARFVQKRTCAAAGRQNKGVKQAGFLVLRETSMPSCLIELGFISTADEERFLHSSNGVSLLAQGIYQAFLDYKRKYDGKASTPVRAEAKQEDRTPQRAEGKQEGSVPAAVPQDDDKSKKDGTKEKRTKKKRSRIAQELADARDGKATADSAAAAPVPTTPRADSILAAAPVLPSEAKQERQDAAEDKTPQQPAQEVMPVAAKPASQPQPAPVAALKPTDTAPATETAQTPAEPAAAEASTPVFKVQILTSGSRLKANAPQLKGQAAAYYQEGGLYKYTVGSSTNYNEIYQLRKTLTASFPQAFIIAFRDSKKMNVQEAIQEFKSRKKK